MTDPTVQRATCAAVLDVLNVTTCTTDAQRDRRGALGYRVVAHLSAPLTYAGAQHSQPTTPPSAVDAVLSWCARELDRVGVP